MKLISTTILLICLVAATFSQWLLIACFDINETYIAKELCINKNNPGTHCNGRCYLNKELNNEEKSTNPLRSSSKEQFEIQLFCIDVFDTITIVGGILSVMYPDLTNFTAQEFCRRAFRPPGMA